MRLVFSFFFSYYCKGGRCTLRLLRIQFLALLALVCFVALQTWAYFLLVHCIYIYTTYSPFKDREGIDRCTHYYGSQQTCFISFSILFPPSRAACPFELRRAVFHFLLDRPSSLSFETKIQQNEQRQNNHSTTQNSRQLHGRNTLSLRSS